MLRDRRVLLVLLAALVVGVPAAVLGAMCFGEACRRPAGTAAPVPFCSLPSGTRELLAQGFRESRSPHVLAVAVVPVTGGTAVAAAPWPTVREEPVAVPLVFAGTGVDPGADVPGGTTLDGVAPTVAEALGLRRPHPGVRSGAALPGVASGERPRLVLLVAWKGVDRAVLDRAPERWPVLRGLMEDGAFTRAAEPGSRPLDPAAVLTTIGTGGLPRDHGMTGTLIRSEAGGAVRAWGDGSPFSVIAALGDDLDDLLDQRPHVGLVATDVADRGLLGGDWYVDHDRDDLAVEEDPGRVAAAAGRLLARGYGADDVPDLLGVVTAGPVRELDRALGELLEMADRAAGGSVLVAVTSTGPMDGDGYPAEEVEAAVERRLGADVIEAVGAGGMFLDQDTLAASGLTDDRVVAAMRGVRDPDGRRLLADAFPALAVTFARYC